VSDHELVALACCDLGGIVRGRSLFAGDLDEHLRAGVSWVPANHALTPLGPLAEPNPFGSTGDLRLVPDPATRTRVPADAGVTPLDLVLCDIVATDGAPWECCPRSLLRGTLARLERELDVGVRASFEHEFQLLAHAPAALAFSLEAQRRVEPFATNVMRALLHAGLAPERFFPEYASHQFEIPLEPRDGLESADRAVAMREVVREVARREGTRATFTPLLDESEAGNGVHLHVNLLDAAGHSMFYDPEREASLSVFGERFAAGIVAHARALSALTAPSVVSAVRLQPNRWSAGAVCLGRQNRETLLRIPPIVALGPADPAEQMHIEYRGADASANPYLALAAVLCAGLEGVRRELPAPPLLERDPGELDAADAERFGVGALPRSLDEALHALEEDEVAHGWMGPLLHEAYASVKRAEIATVAELPLAEVCERYAAVY
jgi:glutamine synthetase